MDAENPVAGGREPAVAAASTRGGWPPRVEGLALWQTAVRSPVDLLRRTVRRLLREDPLAGHAAEMAYYFVFSVFPLLLFLTTLLGYLAQEGGELRQILFRAIARFSPSSDVTRLLRQTLQEVTEGRSGSTLSLSLVGTLWLASSGMAAVGGSLNETYGLEETRPWLWRRLRSLLLVVLASGLIAVSLLLVLFGEKLGGLLEGYGGAAARVAEVAGDLRWAAVAAFVLFSFELVYNFAPDLRGDQRAWFTPGTAVGFLLWIAGSWGFRVYVSHFGVYGRTYGSLGALIVLMLWFYLTALAILAGGVVNAELVGMGRAGPPSDPRSDPRSDTMPPTEKNMDS